MNRLQRFASDALTVVLGIVVGSLMGIHELYIRARSVVRRHTRKD